ncbi:MAG: LLM class flavin-dependent oxidoreductase [Chloroflexi bacterium]|nr:LLM class flavin-dependent oxidoreductase [Chloroflexota bacterium]
MHIMCFTERPYYHVPEDEIIKNASYFGIPNSHFDPAIGSELYNTFFDEALYMEEKGFDGIMLNEHHGTPFCMGSVMNVEAAVLARITQRLKIVLLGNPLPVTDPLRLAEELAMIDMISRGRLVPGFVRGAGSESLYNNANPAYNRELFNEAHDFIIKAWTTPGPFRYEGKHYHYRVVNPWMMPLQKPHPPIWIPGVASSESVVWAAKHRYPYVALAPAMDLLRGIYDLYDETAKADGWTPTDEHRAYAIRINVADTDEKAYEEGKNFYWQLGTSFGVTPSHWQAPPGYISKSSAQGAREVARRAAANITPGGPNLPYEEAQASVQIITGNPDTVIKKLKKIIDLIDPGYIVLWGREGPMSHKVAMRCIDLMSQEVIPAIKEYQAVG